MKDPREISRDAAAAMKLLALKIDVDTLRGTLDGARRLAQLLHVLREHRGGLHLVAVVASGLTPHQAVLTGPGGPDNARFFGYQEPFEEVSHLIEVRAATEDLTDRLVAPAYDVLGHDERADLLALLQTAAAHAYAKS